MQSSLLLLILILSQCNSYNESGSVLRRFLEEPRMGDSWYVEGAEDPTPVFVEPSSNGSEVRVLLGHDALIDCRVNALQHDLVVWMRNNKEKDEHTEKEEQMLPELLIVGFRAPHSSDPRFLLDFVAPNNYRLRVSNVSFEDQGHYICQLAIHPVATMHFRLVVWPPLVQILDEDSRPVAAMHYDVDSIVQILCKIKRPPRFANSVTWLFTPNRARTEREERSGKSAFEGNDEEDIMKLDEVVLNEDVSRGGVSIDTGRREFWLQSKLSLARVKLSDSGVYTCRLKGLQQIFSDSIVLNVHQGQTSEAIQSNEGIKRVINKSILGIFAVTNVAMLDVL